jgi:hypothetical protein
MTFMNNAFVFRAAGVAWQSTAFPMLAGTLVTAAGFLLIATAIPASAITSPISAPVRRASICHWTSSCPQPMSPSLVLSADIKAREKLRSWLISVSREKFPGITARVTRLENDPLCSRHGHESWRFGRLHLCRGCLSLAAGLLSATAAVWILGPAWCVWALTWMLLPVLALSWPRWYRELPRSLRDLLRVGLGVLIVATTAVVATEPTYAWPLLPLSVWLWWRFRRARVQVLARRCDGCPELGRGVCSGYTLHAQAARAISAELEARIEAALASSVSAQDQLRR